MLCIIYYKGGEMVRKNISIPSNVNERLKKEAKRLSTTESNLIVMALTQFFIINDSFDELHSYEKILCDNIAKVLDNKFQDSFYKFGEK